MMHRLVYYMAQIDTSGLPNRGGGDVARRAISVALSIVFGVTAAVAMLILVIAGFRYIISQGDPNAVSQAKNTIIYAVLGLFISLAAFSIVTFVVGSF